MSHIIAFLIGAAVGFLSAWFVWRNNKKKWAFIEAKYDYAKEFLKKDKDA